MTTTAALLLAQALTLVGAAVLLPWAERHHAAAWVERLLDLGVPGPVVRDFALQAARRWLTRTGGPGTVDPPGVGGRGHTGPVQDWRSQLPGPDERAAQEQTITNARPVPPRHLQRTDRVPIAVTARLVWALDGTELVATWAQDWVGRDVRVDLHDRRQPVRGVWLDAADVTRR